ncbi:MAG: hypothetical protein AB7N69_05745 [Immundisolibacter sp.]
MTRNRQLDSLLNDRAPRGAVLRASVSLPGRPGLLLLALRLP